MFLYLYLPQIVLFLFPSHYFKRLIECFLHQHGELSRLLSLLKSSESLSEEQLSGLCILMADFESSLASVQPSAKREGFATVPDVTWADVGALQDIREELTMAILVGHAPHRPRGKIMLS